MIKKDTIFDFITTYKKIVSHIGIFLDSIENDKIKLNTINKFVSKFLDISKTL